MRIGKHTHEVPRLRAFIAAMQEVPKAEFTMEEFLVHHGLVEAIRRHPGMKVEVHLRIVELGYDQYGKTFRAIPSNGCNASSVAL